jgi:beta-galactosidase
MSIDARGPEAIPTPVQAQLGTSRSPRGDVIGVNSQYLTLNGKPWLPVMGEFHYSRYARDQWEPELLKMKAAGVSIVSTYVIWIHHEETEGRFDWSGQRDLRAFVELCAKHGLYVYPRIGPWAHAEARNGGLPDWVLKNSPIRQNDPVYLREVASFYEQIAVQLHGLLWKDGGPVIGIQIENEYRAKGPGEGADHLRTLKKMAVGDGLDLPLYTVTGWDGAAIPLDVALPVFGGYPDAPWDGSPKALAPADVYAFRFANRSAGSMGAIGGQGQSAASTYAGTPFLTAEIGGGIEDTYFRRPVVSADDIAAMAPVMLGSGANLLGFYMFHGGRNPDGGAITLQESQRTGYPTDVPVKSYDFQAPLGEFGQVRESLRKIKLIDYFLEDFGAKLAPMQVHAPPRLPANPSDQSVPRIAARTQGDSGFLFVNNHLRGAQARSFAGFQVDLRLPGGDLRVPAEPIPLVPGVYGIWPVNLDLGATSLRYSTAQLFKRVATGKHTFYFFFAIPGVVPELMLPRNAHIVETSAGVSQQRLAAGIRLRPDASKLSRIELDGDTTLIVLPESQAEELWRGDDSSVLIETGADAFSNGAAWTLQQEGAPTFVFSTFGVEGTPRAGLASLPFLSAEAGLFRRFTAKVPVESLDAKVLPLKQAGPIPPFTMGPSFDWRPQPVPIAPDNDSFERAAVWEIRVPAIQRTSTLADALLRIQYEGDAARLSRGGQLLDDNFWNGEPWEIGLGEVGAMTARPTAVELRILPLPANYPMYLENAGELHFDAGGAIALRAVELVPRYQFQFELPHQP